MLIDLLIILFRHFPKDWLAGTVLYAIAYIYLFPGGSSLLLCIPPIIGLIIRLMFGLRVPWTKWGQRRRLRSLIRKREHEGNDSLDYAERELYLKLQGLVGDEVDGPEY